MHQSFAKEFKGCWICLHDITFIKTR